MSSSSRRIARWRASGPSSKAPWGKSRSWSTKRRVPRVFRNLTCERAKYTPGWIRTTLFCRFTTLSSRTSRPHLRI
ncbi:MAG TPA: hypothetical protein VKE74_20975 [Gemmataceae bacterium]|nr:hypothetical protein [Gemmataceae bacterium]